MGESKGELTDRLRREGRFEAFKKRREDLKAGGTPAHEAWRLAAAEFPPESGNPTPPAPSRSLTKTEIRALKRKPGIKIAQAIRWVFDHLEGDWLQPRDAPSVGAWSLREWARSNPVARSDFYRLFAAKISSIPAEDELSPRKLTKKELDFYAKVGLDPYSKIA